MHFSIDHDMAAPGPIALALAPELIEVAVDASSIDRRSLRLEFT